MKTIKVFHLLMVMLFIVGQIGWSQTITRSPYLQTSQSSFNKGGVAKVIPASSRKPVSKQPVQRTSENGGSSASRTWCDTLKAKVGAASISSADDSSKGFMLQKQANNTTGNQTMIDPQGNAYVPSVQDPADFSQMTEWASNNVPFLGGSGNQGINAGRIWCDELKAKVWSGSIDQLDHSFKGFILQKQNKASVPGYLNKTVMSKSVSINSKTTVIAKAANPMSRLTKNPIQKQLERGEFKNPIKLPVKSRAEKQNIPSRLSKLTGSEQSLRVRTR